MAKFSGLLFNYVSKGDLEQVGSHSDLIYYIYIMDYVKGTKSLPVFYEDDFIVFF
jgi:hypothetical protein